MPTPQTLRESFKEEFTPKITKYGQNTRLSTDKLTNEIADFFLSHFSTILEEVIGGDGCHKTEDGIHKYGCEGCIEADSKNSLRQHQRIIGKEYLK